MTYAHPLIIAILLAVLTLSRTVHSQSFGAGEVLEAALILGISYYRASQTNDGWTGYPPVKQTLPESNEIFDEIERPDEDETSEYFFPALKGQVAELDVTVRGANASFSLGKRASSDQYSQLGQVMEHFHIHWIEKQPGQLDIFPESDSEPTISVMLPIESEPLMPVTGYDWLDHSTGLAFVHYRSMEAIAAIAERAMSWLLQARLTGFAEQCDELDDSEAIWFESWLYGSVDEVPTKLINALQVMRQSQESDNSFAELEFEDAITRIYVKNTTDGVVLGEFEHLTRKSNGGDKKSENNGESTSKNSGNQEGEEEDSASNQQETGSETGASNTVNHDISEAPPAKKRCTISTQADFCLDLKQLPEEVAKKVADLREQFRLLTMKAKRLKDAEDKSLQKRDQLVDEVRTAKRHYEETLKNLLREHPEGMTVKDIEEKLAEALTDESALLSDSEDKSGTEYNLDKLLIKYGDRSVMTLDDEYLRMPACLNLDEYKYRQELRRIRAFLSYFAVQPAWSTQKSWTELMKVMRAYEEVVKNTVRRFRLSRIAMYEWERFWEEEWTSKSLPVDDSLGFIENKLAREIDLLINEHCQQRCPKCKSKLKWSEEYYFTCTCRQCFEWDDEPLLEGFERDLLWYCSADPTHVPEGYHWQCQNADCSSYYHFDANYKDQYTGLEP